MKILLTGATSGIGLATLESLLDEGHTIHAIGRNLEVLSRHKNNFPNALTIHPFDLMETNLIKELFNNFFSDGLKFDSLIHCAGIEETLPITLSTPQKIEEIFRINVFSGIELLRVFSKKRNSNDGSSIVFLASVMGELAQSGKVGYCSTKASILGLVKSSALELSKREIRVNAVSPGVVRTNMTERLFQSLTDENISNITHQHPLGLGTVDDVVPIIKFLISKESKWMTGQNLIIDGGYSIQ